MPDNDVNKILNKLSKKQIQDLKTALEERSSSPSRLSDDQIGQLKKESDRFRQAQRQVTEAVGVLWNAHLDLAIKSGDPAKIGPAMLRPGGGEVAFYDNCNCGGTPRPGPMCW